MARWFPKTEPIVAKSAGIGTCVTKRIELVGPDDAKVDAHQSAVIDRSKGREKWQNDDIYNLPKSRSNLLSRNRDCPKYATVVPVPTCETAAVLAPETARSGGHELQSDSATKPWVARKRATQGARWFRIISTSNEVEPICGLIRIKSPRHKNCSWMGLVGWLLSKWHNSIRS